MLQYSPYGTRLYRSGADVREDIRRVRNAIAEVREKLDIRDLVVASVVTAGHAKDVIPALRTAVEEAEEALLRLRELESELHLLQEELFELL